jgi:predicted RNA-binding protein associated with RNAse of E/G family
LLYKIKIVITNSKEKKTGSSVAEFSKEGCSSKRFDLASEYDDQEVTKAVYLDLMEETGMHNVLSSAEDVRYL